MADSDRYKLLDTKLNRLVPIDVYIKQLDKGKDGLWQKSYAEMLATYLGIIGSSTNAVLAYIIREKDETNIISGTIREIAAALNVSPTTVNRVFKALIKADMLRKIRSGSYMLNGDVIGPGTYARNIAVIQLWNENKP